MTPAVPSKRASLAVFAILGAALLVPARAQQVTARAVLNPATLLEGEQATLQITLANRAAPRHPAVAALDPGVTVTPIQRVQHNIINGEHSYIYPYTVRAAKAGTYTIRFPPLNLGSQVPINPVTLRVLALDNVAKNKYGAPLTSTLFATIDVPNTNLVRRQVTEATFNVFVSGAQVRNIQVDIPKNLGAEKTMRETRTRSERVNGRTFQIYGYKVRFWPKAQGEIEIAPEIQLRISRSSGRFAFGGTLETKAVTVVKPARLRVRPFPEENRPGSFTEAVGSYSFVATTSPGTIQLGEPVTMRLQVESSDGILEQVQAPAFDPGQHFKVYPPKLVEEKVLPGGVGGRKVFEQVIEPTHEAVSNIPPVAFSYFDPRTERYIEIARGPFPVTVNRAADGARSFVPGGVRAPAEDQLLYPMRRPSAWRVLGATAWYKRPGFLAVQVFPPLALVLCLLLARRREHLQTDVAKARRLKAPRAARAGVEAAEAALDDSAAFHEGLWRALTEYFGNRLNLAPGEVEAARVQAEFPEQAETVGALFSACEASRYGAVNHADDLPARLGQLRSLLRACEGKSEGRRPDLPAAERPPAEEPKVEAEEVETPKKSPRPKKSKKKKRRKSRKGRS